MKRFYILCVALLCIITSNSQPGSLDLTFGPGGKVITNIFDRNQSNDIIYAIAVQPDGKIVVAGTSSLPDYPQAPVPSMIMRYNPDGTPDNTFDYDGTYLRYGVKFAALAIQPDGKILAAGTNFSLIRLNSNGSVDNSFGTNGATSITIGSGNTVKSMALQADGKIILAGYYNDGSYNQFALARFTSNGTPDNSFDGDGKLTTDFGPYEDVINGVALQSDGKILVNGTTSNNSTATINSFAVARYNDDGGLDNSFDGDGKLSVSFGAGTDNYGSSIVVQADGKIVIAGHSGNNVAIARYTTTGSPDNSFDGDGKLLTVTGSSFNRDAPAVVLPNGKIVVATYTSGGFGVYRYLSDGTPDNSFDGDGKVTTVLSGLGDYPTCMAVRNNETVLIGGYSLNNQSRDFSIAGYLDNGSPDNSFNGNGKLINVWGANFDIASTIAIQNDGKIIVGGTTAREDISSQHDFAIARYNTDGTLDNAFDGDGRLSLHIVSNSQIQALAIQTDGKIIAAGIGNISGGTYDIVMARFNSNGTLDNTFDGDGIVTLAPTPGNDAVRSIAIQNDGKIVMAVNALLIRLNANGSLDNSFDGDGTAATVLNAVVSLAIQNDGKILAAGSLNTDFALVRYNSNGTPDNSFDGDGLVTTDFGVSEGISSIKIQSDGKIVAGGYSGNSFALARYNSNGSLDNSFDTDGKQTTDMGAGGTNSSSLDIQTDGKIVLYGQTHNATYDFLLARYNSDGGLDNSFDGDGKATLDFGPGSDDHMGAMAISSNRIYMAGWTLTPGGFDFLLAAVVTDPLGGSLPLQLRDFSGKRVGQDALLTWKTEHESNILAYDVERSIDGRNYTTIGSVTSVNSPSIHDYDLTDHNIASLNVPVIYYRLKQKGIDGKYAHSRIVALPLDKNKNFVMFYPNPVVNEANIALTVNRKDNLLVRITDNYGRVVKQQQWKVVAGSTSLSIDVRNLAGGMYYLEIKGESIDYKKQFIK